MSVFFSSNPTPDDTQLAELWDLLENEQFDQAMNLAGTVCQDPNAPIEFFCGLSLAYGENGYYEEAEQVARKAISFGEGHWRARHALAVALMHEGRFFAALDSIGFYRDPVEIYVVRAQVEKMGNYLDSLRITLEDALEQNGPPAVRLYLAYLYSALVDEVPGWLDQEDSYMILINHGAFIDVWERDATRHKGTIYAQYLKQQINEIRQVLDKH